MDRNPELNFRLPSLEKLTLGRLKNSDMLETFRKLCPRLKQLELNFLGKHRNENVTDQVVEFIQNVSETLQNLHIVEADEDVLSAILNIEELRLKRLKVLSPLGEASLINLNCKQPTIETLEIGFIDSTEQLIQLGRSLPALETFSVHLNERHLSALSFLTSMPVVTWLTVRFCACSNLALDRHTPAKQNHLARLTLLAAQYTLSWIAQFPHLRTLELTDCCVESWNEFCVQIVGIEQLQSLKLVEVMSKRKKEVVSVRFEKLSELRMRACGMSGEELKNFVLSGSNLEKLLLEQMPALDDNVALVISQSLGHLRVLHFARCKNITKIAIDQIIDSRCGADIFKFSIDG